MKKIIALALILIIPALVFYIDNAKYSLRNLADLNHTDIKKADYPYSPYQDLKNDSLNVFKKIKNLDPNWEYVKNTLYDSNLRYRQTNTPLKLKGPLLLVLKNATQQDSLAFESVMEELKLLIPKKTISFFSDFTGTGYQTFKLNKEFNDKKIKNYSREEISSSVIQINFFDSTSEKTIIKKAENYFNQNNDARWFRSQYSKSLDFNIREDVSFEKRKQYIQYNLLRSLCLIYPLKSSLFFTKPYPNQNIFNFTNRDPWSSTFTEMDKFLLQKLYANNFEEQFSNYMYKAYSWRYTSYFLNTGFAKLKAFIIVFIKGILAFVLSFNYFQNKTFRNTYLNYLFPCLTIAIHLANLIVIYLYLTNMDLTSYFEQWIAGLIMATILAIVYSFLLWSVEKLVVKKRFKFSFQLVLKMLITAIILNLPLLIGYFIYNTYIEPESSFTYRQEDFYLPVFIALFGLTLLRGLLMYLNHISQSLVNIKDIELSQLKELHAQAETKLLQSQVNPHFLYNALNSIASLAPIDADKTQKMAHSLSDLFKHSINRKGRKMSTIKEEIEMVQSYLEIEKIRFEDRLQFVIQVDDMLKNKEIPLFLIQPLVENAIKHGISKNEGNGKIELKIEAINNELIISISDNGPNFPEGLVSGHGLQMVYDLLRLSYGDKASLNWANTPDKKIIITIPESI